MVRVDRLPHREPVTNPGAFTANCKRAPALPALPTLPPPAALTPAGIQRFVDRVWAHIEPNGPTANGLARATKIVQLLVNASANPGSAMDNKRLEKKVMKLAKPNGQPDDDESDDEDGLPPKGNPAATTNMLMDPTPL
jgi:hypothetical protein